MPYVDKLTQILKETFEKSGKLDFKSYTSRIELKLFFLMSDFLVNLATLIHDVE